MTSEQDLRKEQDKDHDPDWQDLARLASQEKDPERLMELIRRLNGALENGTKDGGRNPPTVGPVTPPQSRNGSKLAEVA